MEMKTLRDITTEECDWLHEDIKAGTAVYEYTGTTYGCISPFGIAVTMADGQTPFFELPCDAVG